MDLLSFCLATVIDSSGSEGDDVESLNEPFGVHVLFLEKILITLLLVKTFINLAKMDSLCFMRALDYTFVGRIVHPLAGVTM